MPPLTSRLLVLLLLTVACAGGGIEGRYFNAQSGDFAFELKGGKVYDFSGKEDPNLEYQVRGNEVVVRPKTGGSLMGEMVFTRQGDELVLGPGMSLKKQ